MVPSFSAFFPTSASQAVVTPPLVSLLPSASTTRSRITTAIEETMKMRPCFNMKNFRTRAENMFAWAKEEDGRAAAGASVSSSNTKADLARSIFFPSSYPPPSAAPLPRLAPTLSFFASVAAAYALGVLICKENEMASEVDFQKTSTETKIPRLEENRTVHSQKAPVWNKYSASGLFALSRQAMAAFEMVHTYDLDSIVAYLLQIIYLLHDSRPRVAHVTYPLLGKVINIAYMMGLSTDPDEFPGRFSLFEAEQRRRVWWDIYYYDVFISDAMGQAPSIQDSTFTTKLPADVDEEQFAPSSTSLPLPLPRRAGGDPTEVGFAYFIQKCRSVVALPALLHLADVFSVLHSSSRVSEGDVLVRTPTILQSPRSSAQNSSSQKSRLGCRRSQKCFASTLTTTLKLYHPPKCPSPRIFRPSVAN
ncbi:fungal-specific transcription factor domain-containing protein [Russula brevipes]|nr:fungal-specific transcription factor domain-containing protein [Russula brevipes]